LVKSTPMTSLPDLDQMTPEQLRTLAAQLMSKVDTQSRKIHRDETIIEQLTHEIAILKRHKFAKRSEQISPAQSSLLEDLLNTDLEAIEAELRDVAERTGKKLRVVTPPLFVAMSGSSRSLPLFDSMALLGRSVVRQRLKVAIAVVATMVGSGS